MSIIKQSFSGTINLIKFAFYVIIVSIFSVDLFALTPISPKTENSKLIMILVAAVIMVYIMLFKPVRKYRKIIERADYFEKMGFFSRAIKVLTVCLSLTNIEEDEKAELSIKIGKLYVANDNISVAEEYFNKLSSFNLEEERFCEVMFYIANTYSSYEYFDKAVEYFDKCFNQTFSKHIQKVNIDADTFSEVMDSYIAANKLKRAREIYQILLENNRIKPIEKFYNLLYTS